MTSRMALVPEYMKQFKCIGPECEDTCCAFWNVSIDRSTYKRYNSVKHTTLSRQLKANVQLREEKERSETNYAYMKLDEKTGSCCFLEDGLCSIQAKLGPSYLSKTCNTYPRRIYEINGEQEVSAILSCPEAARLALLRPEGIEFTYMPELTASNFHKELSIKTDLSHLPATTKHFWELRVIAIELLQNRTYSLDHRFMQLAVLADRIDETLKSENQITIPEIIESFKLDMQQGNEITDPSIFPVLHSFQLRFLNDLLLTVYEKKIWHNLRYKQCLDDYLRGIQPDDSSSLEQVVAHYEEIYKRWYAPFMEKYDYILENYLVNTIFSSLFPVSKNESVFEQVKYIGLMYSLIRMHLIGMSAVNKGLTVENVVKLIQSFTKNFEHSRPFKKEVRTKCEQENVMDLGHLSLIVMH